MRWPRLFNRSTAPAAVRSYDAATASRSRFNAGHNRFSSYGPECLRSGKHPTKLQLSNPPKRFDDQSRKRLIINDKSRQVAEGTGLTSNLLHYKSLIYIETVQAPWPAPMRWSVFNLSA